MHARTQDAFTLTYAPLRTRTHPYASLRMRARSQKYSLLENNNKMASSNDNISMAVYCDFENVALGVRDANYEKFDIKPVLERLLLKGSIVVKKAYCDWERYKGFKATMHEANFELIEIPHVRQSGKNSADIRLVVDALDLCYTKSHVNTFVIISGDSDFSPLVSKLRENAKYVIGVGVKQSTSDLLIANCDEFIFYDDLVRESRRVAAKRDARVAEPAPKRSPDEASRRKEDLETRKSQAIEMAVDTFDALVSERGDSGKIWASMLKEAIKRRKPDFSESYYGFRTFGNLLEEAQNRGMLEFGRDEKSGAYVYRSNLSSNLSSSNTNTSDTVLDVTAAPDVASAQSDAVGTPQAEEKPRRGGRGGRKTASERREAAQASRSAGGAEIAPIFEPAPEPVVKLMFEPAPEPVVQPMFEPAPESVAVQQAPPTGERTREQPDARRSGRGQRARSGRDQPRRASHPTQDVPGAERAMLEPSMFEPAMPVVERATLEPSMFEPVMPVASANRATIERATLEPAAMAVEESAPEAAPQVVLEAAPETAQQAAPTARKGRAPRQPAAKKAAPPAVPVEVAPVVASFEVAPAEAKPKAPARSRRPRKTPADAE